MTGTAEELEAMNTVAQALDRLVDADARARVLSWATAAYAADGVAPRIVRLGGRASEGSVNAIGFRDVAALIDRANPDGTQDRVLTVAYWFQDLQGGEDFDSKSVNDVLKDLGHPAANITKELTRLMEKSPQLVRQIEKSGRSRQARKRYRLTDAGRRRVQEMISNGHS
jgi:hypothetical protein